jgi:hypothetical protein
MAHTTIKITQLPSASSADVTSATDVLPIIDGNTTKQITVDNLFGAATNITASGDISASGDIIGTTGSYHHINLQPLGSTSPSIFFNTSAGPDFTLGFIGNNTLSLQGSTGAAAQSFALDSKVENFDIREGGTIHMQYGVTTGSKHGGGLWIDAQGGASSNNKATQLTADSTGPRLLNTSYGGTGTHGTFKFINGGNVNNAIDSDSFTVAEFGPTSSAHFSFYVPTKVSSSLTVTGSVNVSGSISASGNIIASSGSFGYINVTGGITASNLFLDANTLFIGGTSFSKTDVDNLKAGKSIATDSDKKFVNSADATTYIRMGTSAKAWHYISDVPVLKLASGLINVGDSSTRTEIGAAGIGGGSSALIITGSSGMQVANGGLTAMAGMVVTGSTNISGSSTFTGSFEQSGSSTFTGGGFVVNDLLNLLANFGNVGLPTGSGAGNVSAGDINLDGQVNITDLLLLLAGYGNPNTLSTNLTIPQNTNYQLVGPEITVSQSIVVTVGTNSFFSIT